MNETIESFVEKNIININNKINDFKYNKFHNDTEIKEYLKQKLRKELRENKDKLIQELKDRDYIKKCIKEIANKYVYYAKDLERFYVNYMYKDLLKSIKTEELVNSLRKSVSEKIASQQAFKFIKKDFDKLSEKIVILLKMKGFSTNILGLNEGVMLANSGDSAQFLFLSRAILAGFNCSNVDVRSSRYDAIIDFEGTLLKVQVKGISDNNISFKDRDRGGQGIDHKHERNIGQIITSKDCDIYAAVDKQIGICYLIPMKQFVDKLPIEEKEKPINIDKVEIYRENWEVIKTVAKSKSMNIYKKVDKIAEKSN